MERLRYTLWRFATDVGGLLSRMAHAWIYGGSTAMTLSVRAHIEASRGDPEWTRRRDFINRIFFLQDDHCAHQWAEEVERARYTLRLLENGFKD